MTNKFVAHPPASDPAARFRVGTLTYTKAGLAALFVWLLWGGFCFTLMETVIPSVVPLKLKDLGAPNWIMGAILTSLPQILNVLLNPIISTASDRHRGRFGRRMPFMLIATPFVSAGLCVIGLAPGLGPWLHAHIGSATGWNAAAVTVGLITFALALFRLSELFINTVYWYLFNDVVPQAFMARFLGLFRAVGTAAGALFSYFIFPHAITHFREIFIGAGVLFFTGFTLMCLRVKEGPYPPPAPYEGGRGGLWAAARTYLKECLSHRLYGFFFLANVFGSLAGACGLFNVFWTMSLGLTLRQIGTLNAALGVAYALLTYPAGALVDRFHPLRVMLWINLATLATTPMGFLWLFTQFAPEINYRIVVATSVAVLPLSLISGAAGLPMYMRILPRDRFGQFCSFNALCQAGVSVVAGVVAGGYIDLMRRVFPDAVYGKDYCYRLITSWMLAFSSIALIFLVLVYREWQRLGGESGYTPPGTTPAPPAG